MQCFDHWWWRAFFDTSATCKHITAHVNTCTFLLSWEGAVRKPTEQLYWVRGWCSSSSLQVLCSAFVTKTMPVTHRCSGYCWAVVAQCLGCLCFPRCLPQQAVWWWEGAGRRHSWDRWPKLSKGYSISYNIMVSGKGWRGALAKVAIACRLAGHQSAAGRWCVIMFTSLFLKDLLLICLYLGSQVFTLHEQALTWLLSCWPASTHRKPHSL